MRSGFVVWFVLMASCSSAKPPQQPPPPPEPSRAKAIAMPSALSSSLEAELDTIRKDPRESVGFGEKADHPYEPNSAPGLIGSDDPKVTERLLAEVRSSTDRVYRLAVVHVLGKRADPTVDAALVVLLDDPVLRATAAYVLGRAGYKGYAPRPRDVDAVRTALRRHLDDPSTFEDPFYRRTFRTQDFVLGAYVRLTGIEKFRIANMALGDLIGLSLPEMTDAERGDLLAQAKQLR
jgi:hypothetical protein